MTLNCTLVGGPGAPRSRPPVELSIDVPEGTSGSVIQEQLLREFGSGAVRVDGEDLCSLVVGTPPLVEAAVLVDGGSTPGRLRPRAQVRIDSGAPLALTIDSGVAAGTVVPLSRGSYSIGRSGTRIVIPDPELSREHARLVVRDTDIVLIDVDSANGTYVDGVRIRSAVVSTDSSIRCGQSNMSLAFTERHQALSADAGRSVTDPIVLSGRMDTPNRAVLMLTAVLPLGIGVLLAVLTGMWMFLAFSAVSAVSVLVPVLGGRRQRRELSSAVRAAVEEDRNRRRRCAPSLSVVALAARDGTETSGNGSESGGVWLRLGEAEQQPNIRIEPASVAFRFPPLGMVPILLDPDRPLTTVAGPRFATDGVIRALLMQLAGYPRAAATHVVVHGQPGTLPLAARYLPRVTLTATTNAGLSVVARGLPTGCERGVLFIRGESSSTATEQSVRNGALQHGWQVLHFLPEEAEPPSPDVLLSERCSVLRLDARETVFVPDFAPSDVFTRFCRLRAGTRSPSSEQASSVPAACSLEEVLPLAPHATAERWISSEADDGLAVPLGLGASGPRYLDLHADGPHLLVAGTTGSGKSELLRSLTIALALSYPPERVNFFFIDFKGGSGLGPLSDLVHCVGLQTDLSAAEVDRTLTSLRAEVRLRERCLAAARVPDISAYRSTPAGSDFVLPHLVIVIDEFRMLVDDAPEVLRELLRIASIGRSLGIHLVMATQRPQGALTADIRANVTSSIALRVQSDIESVDIIKSKDAAAISVDAPGRAFLARGTEPAVEFQGASLASISGVKQPRGVVAVYRTTDYLARQVSDRGNGPVSAAPPARVVEPLAAMVRSLSAAQEKQLPRRPVAPPLPEHLEEPVAASPASSPAGHVRLGLMDVPEEQQVRTLLWSTARHGHAAFIGGPASGAGEALETAVNTLMHSADESHFYILDAPGTFLPLGGAGRTGAHAGLHDLRRGVRILERLGRELGQRLASAVPGRVPLVLVIAGWGSWVSAFRSGPLAWAEDLVQDLVRDGAGTGITVMFSGERELVTARFFGAVPNRFYFPAGSTEEARAMWPRMPAVPSVEGRAAAFGPVTGGGPVVCQFYRNTVRTRAGGTGTECPPASSQPFRVDPLPTKIAAPQVAGSAQAQPRPAPIPIGRVPAGPVPAGRERGGPTDQLLSGPTARQRSFFIGVSGDEPAPASFRMPGGGLVAVLGSPGSGKSNTLHALKALNPGHPWCECPASSEASGAYLKDMLVEAEAGNLSREMVLLVDNIDLLAHPAVRDLGQLNALGCSMVVTAAYSPLLLQRVPLLMSARAAGVGILLGPRSPADCDLFASRFEIESNPPPGRGVLIAAGRSEPIQVAWAGEDG